MAPTLKPITHLLMLLLLGGSYVSCEEKWCYDKPSCGPLTWKRLGQCNGKKQSPINIVTTYTQPDSCLGPLTLSGYEDRWRPRELLNKGDYPDVEMKEGATVSSPSLPAKYHLKSFHFHFGTNHHAGSEHAINGQHYSMELHVVHTKNGISTKEAAKDPQGFVVLGFFIQKSFEAPFDGVWNFLASSLRRIPEKGDSVPLNGEFSLSDLLRPGGRDTVKITDKYYRYQGSLTTPNCSEAVTWFVFPNVIKVHPYVVKKFTNSLFFTTKEENRRMQDNYRPVQPLNNRRISAFNLNEYDPAQCPGNNFGAEECVDCKD
ncbi:carbonic anhydrase 4-like [Podarcis raffonei]|uniref:carbonic anhydrase 4-like n=1 Tax=Podarcis raffonei TaxID=65483 RepID=UPI0023294E4D|nr:carbonic anhydrase 4-like [Podarcis raffonei]